MPRANGVSISEVWFSENVMLSVFLLVRERVLQT